MPPPRPAAIQIRAPTATQTALQDDGRATPGGSRLSAAKAGGERGASPRPPPMCRNVLIHGSCKYENEGCRYSHPPAIGAADNGTAASPRLAGATALTHDAPVFVPGGALSPTGTSPEDAGPFALAGGMAKLSTAAAEFAPSNLATMTAQNDSGEQWGEQEAMGTHDGDQWYGDAGAYDGDPSQTPSYPSTSAAAYSEQATGAHNPYAYDAGAGDGYGDGYPPTGASMSNYRHTLNYHLYAPSLPHTSNQHPQQMAINSFFMPPSIRESLQKKSEAIIQGPTHEVARTPEDLGVYNSLVVINAPGSGGPPKIFGHPTWWYKATCALDGKPYALLRVEGFQPPADKAQAAIGLADRWRKLRHPGIVNVREAFTTRAFGDNSLLFVMDYHPTSQTLLEAHLLPSAPVRDPRTGRFGPPPPNAGVGERLLWSYIIQIANAMRAVHNAGFAVRTVDPSKILITGPNRVRLNGLSVIDVLTYDGSNRLAEHQQEDLLAFGRLICALGCTSMAAVANLPKAVETLGRVYTPDVREVALYLLQPLGPGKSINELMEKLWTRSLDELTASFNANDLAESYLMRELENGRLVRLMAKFGFINERPEFDHDPRWAETGDRYLVKLFRDYVFHQVDELGRPVVDLSHVLVCLNKLDAAVDEKIMLVSRDDQNCSVVSYAEIRRCVDAAFRDLSRR